jgi:dihydrofolate reductase
VVYIAVSLDGYIADGAGDVHWLEAFEKDDYGFEEFLESIGSILMGRVTYDQIISFEGWSYGETPTLVWSGGKVEDLPAGAVAWSENMEKTAAWLKEQAGARDVWILGGARTIQTFLDAGMIDRMDLFVIPVLLGGGVRLFGEEGGDPRLLKLDDVQPYANGVVKLSYTRR